MNKYIVTFSTTYQDKVEGFSDFELKQIRLIESAKRFGISNIKKWTRKEFLKEPFYDDHKDLLDVKVGAGMWIWKPYIILEALKKVKEGDFVVYSDTSLFFSEDPEVLFRICEQNNGFFFIEMDSSWKLSMLCKRDVFHYLNIDNENYYNAPLTEAFFMIFQKKPETVNFLIEWLSLCLDKKLIHQNSFSGLNEISNFKGHPCDMPLLAISRLKHNIEGFRNPSQFGNHLKLPEYRIEGEFLIEGKYWENEVYFNSPYGTLLTYDKEGFQCKRPMRHFLSLSFLKYKIKERVSQ